MVLLGSIFLLLNMGILSLGLASLISILIGRILLNYYFWRNAKINKLYSNKKKEIQEMIFTLRHNAYRMGWVMLGSYLITNANILLASSFLGLEEVVSYILTFQLLIIISSISTTVYFLFLPKLNNNQFKGKTSKIIDGFALSLISAWLLFLIGASILLGFGNLVFDSIGSSTALLPFNISIVFTIIIFLEMNHSLCANLITTFNQIPFVKSALISGVLILTNSIFLVGILKIGVWGLILSQGIVQILYNNWK